MYRAKGLVEMKPVGEVEFCAGIVGHANLALGDRVAGVLEAQIAAGDGRFRGVRHGAAWDEDAIIGNSHVATGPGLHRDAGFRAGLEFLTALGLRSTPGSSVIRSPR